jgi:PRTRC genetic system protein F
MQFNSAESDALQQSQTGAQHGQIQQYPHSLFLLPNIHPDIPRRTVISDDNYQDDAQQHEGGDLNALALKLIQCGVIKPDEIPDHAETTQEIISIGLSKWVSKKTGDISTIPFKFAVIDFPSLIEVAEYTSADADLDCYFENVNFVLAAIGEETQIRQMKGKLDQLNKFCPRLALTAIRAIYEASPITTDIWLPHEVFSEFARYYWEEYGNKLPSDDEVIEYVVSNFDAEDPESAEYDQQIKSMLPSSVIPAMGGKACLDFINKRQLLTRKQLTRLARSTGNRQIKDIAYATSDLLKAISQANRIDARLTDDDIPFATRDRRGLLLVNEFSDQVEQIVDAEINDAWQSGTATEVIGFIRIPEHPYQIKRFFHKIEKACAVLKKLDELVGLISERYYRD